jgi:hypothetical protein
MGGIQPVFKTNLKFIEQWFFGSCNAALIKEWVCPWICVFVHVPVSSTPMYLGALSSQGMPAMTSTASAPPTPMAQRPSPPPLGVCESVPMMRPPGKAVRSHRGEWSLVTKGNRGASARTINGLAGWIQNRGGIHHGGYPLLFL